MEWLLIGAALAAIAIWEIRRRMGFARQLPEDYREVGPLFDIQQHLNGPILCEGVIFGPTGRVSSRFTADFEAEWRGTAGRMAEHFRYNDGSTQDREWRLTLNGDGTFRAEADDLVGVGHGVQTGSGVRLTYRIRLPEDAGGHVLDVVDWMYLVENGTIINRSQFRKYGIKLAELVATMRPQTDQVANRREADAA